MTAGAGHLSLERVDKRFPGGLLALRDVNLRVAEGEFVSLLGPSGCGKSTVLRLVAGLDVPSAGRVDAPALHGDAGASTAFVFQEPTLMPWASVFDNVWLPLRLAGVARASAAEPVRTMLHSVGLAEFERAYPAELSGGMKMRASIARALVTQPRLLLMDEPFAALDEITRHRLNADLLAWWAARRLSALFVTHSVYEAVFLSQRVLVMGARPGRVVTEVAVTEPYPRGPAFRTSVAYAQACRELSTALEAAQRAPVP
jgi:NitT/TauT family transport system ATP-binding protein